MARTRVIFVVPAAGFSKILDKPFVKNRLQVFVVFVFSLLHFRGEVSGRESFRRLGLIREDSDRYWWNTAVA